MTCIAQNEYAALYVPAAFIAHVSSRYHGLLVWLARHVQDEAPHRGLHQAIADRRARGLCRRVD
jgi:hypothetical protein